MSEEDGQKDLQQKTKEFGEKLQSIGCLLTVLLTIPIILTIVMGVPGLIISIIIIVAYLYGNKKQKDEKWGEKGVF